MSSCVLERELPTIGHLSESLDGSRQAHGRKAHLVCIGLSQAKFASFPKMSDALGAESKELCSYNVRGNCVGTRNYKAGFYRVAPKWTAADHRRVTNNDGEIDMKAPRHSSDKRVHVREKDIRRLLAVARMSIVVCCGK